MINGTQIDGVVFRVERVEMVKGETWYVVKANKHMIFSPDQEYFISQHAIDAYQERGQIRDAVRECSI